MLFDIDVSQAEKAILCYRKVTVMKDNFNVVVNERNYEGINLL